jgi:hypothetical protein
MHMAFDRQWQPSHSVPVLDHTLQSLLDVKNMCLGLKRYEESLRLQIQ